MLAEQLRKITNTIKEDNEFETLKRMILDCARQGKSTTGFFNIKEKCPITFKNGHIWNYLRQEGIGVEGSYSKYQLYW